MKQILLFVFILTIIISAQQFLPDAQSIMQNSNTAFFIENKGQWDLQVRYLTQKGGLNAWITDNGVVYDFYKIERNYDLSEIADMEIFERQEFIRENTLRSGNAVKITHINANLQPGDERIGEHEAYYNYFVGEKSKWESRVKLFDEVRQTGIYDGIDIRYYFDEGLVRYDYKAAPNADILQIRMNVEGAAGVSVNTGGELVIQTSIGEVVHGKLIAYQREWFGMKPVECGFALNEDGSVGFDVAEYNRNKELVIDPVVFSSFLGGSDEDIGYDVVFNSLGNVVVGGTTKSTDFPVAGPYTGHSGYYDMFVTMFNSAGNGLIFSTYIGGANTDYCQDFDILSNGDFVGIGYTNSTDFAGGVNSIQGGYDVAAFSLSGDGSSINYAVVFGGSATEVPFGAAVASDDDLYVSGYTNSANFPITNGSSYSGSQDFFISRIDNSTNVVIASTLLGGSGNDYGHGIAVDASDNVFVIGQTYSSNFPIIPGAADNVYAGTSEVVVSKFNSDFTTLLASTYLGGSSSENAHGIVVDASGYVYATGYTTSSNYYTSANAYQTSNAGGGDGFITKLSNDLTTYQFSTLYGGSDYDYPYDIALLNGNEPIVVMDTYSTDLPVSLNPFQATRNGDQDLGIAYFDETGENLLFGTYYGGGDYEMPKGIETSSGGQVAITGYTWSNDYPTTTGAFQTSHSDPTETISDAFVTLFTPDPDPVKSIELTVPNGGETWIYGNNYNISWTSSGITSVDIEYSTNNGSSWVSTPIATGVTASLGTYSWTVPDLFSDQCLVRVVDASDGTINDVSDAVFTIDNRSLEVTSPNGGEVWRARTTREITWNSHNVGNVKIEYTHNDGLWWNTIINSTPSDGSYEWTVTDFLFGSSCRVRITDVSDASISDVSNGFFRIVEPYITIAKPESGDIWRAGTTENITWWVANVSAIKIEYSTNYGTSWNVITDSTDASTYSYAWTVPDLYATNASIRISDVEIPSYNAYSDPYFIITNASITVTSPNGGEVWRARTTREITWNSNNVGNVKIEYTHNDGLWWNTIINSTPSDGSYEWTVTDFLFGSACRVRITNVADPVVADVSDGFFRIVEPYITIAKPESGDIWRAGTTENITWWVANVSAVKIEYSTNYGTSWNVITDSTDASTYSYAWTVPDLYATNASIRISDVEIPSYNAYSDPYFTIDNRGVTVTSPNGGEVWEAGTAKAIAWTASGIANVKIEYSTNNGTGWSTVVNSLDASLGTFNWTVPNAPTVEGLVRITDVSDGTITDQSNAVFEIFAPSVTVGTPNGGETYRAGTTETITWAASGIDNVKIEYSTDNGGNWNLIDPSVAGSLGTFDWTVPNVESSQCLIRLSDELDPTIVDVSDALFAIEKPSVTLNFSVGWNVMSAPFNLDDPTASNVFPTKISDIFAYSYGYYIIYNIQPAQGFWVKFPASGSNTVEGSGNSDSTVQVFAGWNIIGAPEYDVLVADITPTNIIISDFYEYGGGYTPVTTLVEGKGYWVKCSQPGTLLLPRQAVTKVEPLFTPEEEWITVTVSDAAGNSQQLYVADQSGMFELPPVPPNEIFDVRFGDDSYLCTEDALSKLRFQSEDYPLTISVTGGNLKLTDGATGRIINRQLLDGESMTITNKNIGSLNINTVEIPADYVLYQNYPNPFNPATTIKFGLPQTGKVEIVVYDQLGQKVETLISEELEAGYHEFEWNAMQYSSGVYFYTINAGQFKSVKKMLLLK